MHGRLIRPGGGDGEERRSDAPVQAVDGAPGSLLRHLRAKEVAAIPKFNVTIDTSFTTGGETSESESTAGTTMITSSTRD